VTIVERNPRLLHREDQDVSAGMETLFHDEGIALILNATVEEVSGVSGQAVTVIYQQNGTSQTAQGSHLLVARGRTPNTKGLGLELAGVELTERVAAR
jgi:pyruvate/2-oxoglutarate dehydrogenase complex dihydrolipoamide dehydrogenase (E3) component